VSKDKIILSGVPLHCHIGVPDAERSRPQQIIVDLEIELDTRAAAATDDITTTVNYSNVVDALEELAGASRVRLIEALAERMAERVLLFPSANGVLLRIKKPGALASRGIAYAAVEISRRKTSAENG
jgi:dihydroneopterin aldolase